MTCSADYLLEIIKNEYNNNSFHYKNILLTQNEDGLCFMLSNHLDQASDYIVPVYEPLRFIASLINSTEQITNKTLFEYPLTLEVYPYIKILWERYNLERNYYN